MMSLADLAIFVETVNVGSLAGAARRLKIPAMTASRRLAALEAELGVRLLHRTTRGLSLTGDGETLLPYAQGLVEGEQALRQALAPSTPSLSGLLRITASVPFGRKILTPFIGAFLQQHPDLRIDLQLQDGVVDIVNQGIDCAIRIGVLEDSRLIAQAISGNPRGLYAAPAYLDRMGRPQAIEELASHACLVRSGTTHWCFGPNSQRQRVRGVFSANSVEALHQAAIHAMGIALLSDWDASDDVAAGLLEPLPMREGLAEPLQIWAIYPTTRFVPPKVRHFIAALKSHLIARFPR
ncbi:LysR family transcriptional regulator [Sphingobium sp. HBC34]|uniref:LysR family transcriptional regulator n=1 Tax=Sphingobium cyanobacteriorum TaxID=3063954 RepID=A0ABT8ZN61_9SPHN|nr:LysR family transcriptional regulator [Sphingobium sp. HBC34]MDO7835627.1 LysR family transcriptional regulator [Sphingobium sp. HBC34]